MTNRATQLSPEHLQECKEKRAAVRAEWLRLAQCQCECLSTARHIGVLVAIATSCDRELTEEEEEAISWMMHVQTIAMRNVQDNHNHDKNIGSEA